jgi:hypothetical protein
LLRTLWENGLAGAGAVALLLGLWLGAKAVGLLDRPKHWVRSTYLPPQDLLGFFAMPHFVVQYENLGNVPVAFSDFELVLPRFEKVAPDGSYTMHLGAEFFIDKRPTSTIGALQHIRAVDYRSNKVRLEPGEAHTDFFDLGAFVGNGDPPGPLEPAKLPTDFNPVLTFHDSFGSRYHCDAEGIHVGRWESPMLRDMRAAGASLKPDTTGLLSQRRLIRWFGWTKKATPARFDLEEPRLVRLFQRRSRTVGDDGSAISGAVEEIE